MLGRAQAKPNATPMLVSPLIHNMSTHFLLLLRECVVTASAVQGDREGIVPSRSAAVGAKRPGAGPNLDQPAAISLTEHNKNLY